MVGQGRSRHTASAVERLLAARLADVRDDRSEALADLEEEERKGDCPIQPKVIDQWIAAEIDKLGWEVATAVPQPSDGLGDVKVIHQDGTRTWIEVKAQTKAASIRDIGRADWIRDETDFLARLAKEDRTFASLLPRDMKKALSSFDQVPGLSLAELLVCDVALVHSPKKKDRAGIVDRQTLVDFVANKSVFLVSQSGIRHVPLGSLRPVAGIFAGGQPQIVIRPGTESSAIVDVSVGAAPVFGNTQVRYYVAYASGVLGRHKVNFASLP